MLVGNTEELLEEERGKIKEKNLSVKNKIALVRNRNHGAYESNRNFSEGELEMYGFFKPHRLPRLTFR